MVFSDVTPRDIVGSYQRFGLRHEDGGNIFLQIVGNHAGLH
jgi:hypothetical protein